MSQRHELLAAHDTIHGYDRWSASYDADPNPLVAATTWALDTSPLKVADCDVLELGCGTGRHAGRVIADGARSYVGLDGSTGMLAVAMQGYNDARISFGQVDLLSPWTIDQQFDVALMVLVLEHLPAFDHVLASLSRALRPGGRARVLDLHPERVANGTYAHFHSGATTVHFTSVAHAVPQLLLTSEAHGFTAIRRDWLATDAMITAVPSLEKFRGTKLLLDLQFTRNKRERRGSAT